MVPISPAQMQWFVDELFDALVRGDEDRKRRPRPQNLDRLTRKRRRLLRNLMECEE